MHSLAGQSYCEKAPRHLVNRWKRREPVQRMGLERIRLDAGDEEHRRAGMPGIVQGLRREVQIQAALHRQTR